MTNQKYAQYVGKLAARNRTHLVGESHLHAAVGLAGESGELLDKVKKVWWQRHPMDKAWREDICLELGDILFYLQFMCNNLGVTLETVRDKNVEKLTKRYPGGKYTVEESVNRKELKCNN